MPKLKQTDKRPVGQFEAGDIVKLHPRYGAQKKQPGPGIVLEIVNHTRTPDASIDQTLYILFASTEEELFTSSRQYARKRVKHPSYNPVNSTTYSNRDIVPDGPPHPEWIMPPSKDELDMERFMDMFDDLS